VNAEEDCDSVKRTTAAAVFQEIFCHGDRGRLTNAHSNGHPKRTESTYDDERTVV
jgi:hypothetical protein